MAAPTGSSGHSKKKTRPALSSSLSSTTSTSSSTSATASTHPYLNDREISAIQHWNSGIPTKPTRADQDLAVQEYLQAKWDLFHHAVHGQRPPASSVPTARR